MQKNNMCPRTESSPCLSTLRIPIAPPTAWKQPKGVAFPVSVSSLVTEAEAGSHKDVEELCLHSSTEDTASLGFFDEADMARLANALPRLERLEVYADALRVASLRCFTRVKHVKIRVSKSLDHISLPAGLQTISIHVTSKEETGTRSLKRLSSADWEAQLHSCLDLSSEDIRFNQ
jgi:hypothetical protein